MQKNNSPSFPIPTEAEEQIALFEWARLQTGRFPELALLYHVPNGGSEQNRSGTPSGAGREIRRSRSLPSGCTRGKSRAIH